jgi:hypothetical protein
MANANIDQEMLADDGNRNVSVAPCILNDCAINYVNEVKDLGVRMHPTLKFNGQIDSVVAKARSRAFLIRKCFVSRNPEVMTRAFCVYVRPLLEYASSVWSPQYSGAIDKIESVQRRFTKRLRGFNHLDYPSRLQALGLHSLEKRRLCHDLALTYKFIFGLLDVQSCEFFTIRCVSNMTTRGNPYKLAVSNCRINVRQHYFTERVAPVWNSLPPSIVNFSSLSSLKKLYLRLT